MSQTESITTQGILVSAYQLYAAMFASTDPSRSGLSHLVIEPDGTTWATDGHTLIKMTWRNGAAPKAEDFPTVALPADAVAPTAKVMIPITTAAAALKALPKKARIPILRNALLSVSSTHAYLSTTDLDSPATQSFRLPDGYNFPDVARVVDDALTNKATGHCAGVDPAYLERVGKMARLGGAYPKMTITSATHPIRFEWNTEDHDVFVLVMPRRIA